MIKARMLVENPENVEVTLKLTLTIKEWGEIRDQLITAYPSWCLSSVIINVLSAIRKVHYEEKEFKSP